MSEPGSNDKNTSQEVVSSSTSREPVTVATSSPQIDPSPQEKPSTDLTSTPSSPSSTLQPPRRPMVPTFRRELPEGLRKMLEKRRDEILRKYPRAFDPTLSPEERREMEAAMDRENFVLGALDPQIPTPEEYAAQLEQERIAAASSKPLFSGNLGNLLKFLKNDDDGSELSGGGRGMDPNKFSPEDILTSARQKFIDEQIKLFHHEVAKANVKLLGANIEGNHGQSHGERVKEGQGVIDPTSDLTAIEVVKEKMIVTGSTVLSNELKKRVSIAEGGIAITKDAEIIAIRSAKRAAEEAVDTDAVIEWEDRAKTKGQEGGNGKGGEEKGQEKVEL